MTKNDFASLISRLERIEQLVLRIGTQESGPFDLDAAATPPAEDVEAIGGHAKPEPRSFCSASSPASSRSLRIIGKSTADGRSGKSLP